MSDTVIELDDRRRASLGKVGRPEDRRYLVREEPGGILVFIPAVVITETEDGWLANPGLVEQLRESVATHPRGGVRRERLSRSLPKK